jgi:hypothetical protein
MKNIRLFLSAFVVFAIVSSALAFKAKPFGAGSIYCVDNGTTCSDIRNFKVDRDNGTVTDICNGQEFTDTGSDCVPATGPFKSVPAGK